MVITYIILPLSLAHRVNFVKQTPSWRCRAVGCCPSDQYQGEGSHVLRGPCSRQSSSSPPVYILKALNSILYMTRKKHHLDFSVFDLVKFLILLFNVLSDSFARPELLFYAFVHTFPSSSPTILSKKISSSWTWWHLLLFWLFAYWGCCSLMKDELSFLLQQSLAPAKLHQ